MSRDIVGDDYRLIAVRIVTLVIVAFVGLFLIGAQIERTQLNTAPKNRPGAASNESGANVLPTAS